MTEQEIAELRSEIIRQRGIIDALLLQNRQQQQKINEFNTREGSTEPGSSVSEKGNGITDVSSSISENRNGITDFGISITEKRNGITGTSPSISEIGNGITGFNSSISEKGNGITGSGFSISRKAEVNETNWVRLRRFIKESGYRGSSRSGLKNTAKLLLHFYNESGSGYPELKKLTGLSDGGVAKHMMMLKKKGWVKRVALQQYELSAYARQLVEKALAPYVPPVNK